MTFNSPSFLFLFLPAVLALYFLLGRRFRNATLLLFSLLFYAWGEKAYIVILLFFILINYLFGLWLNRKPKASTDAPMKLVLGLAVTSNLSMLVFFKYTNFFISNINLLLSAFGIPQLAAINVHNPLGISFITFTAISYIVDIYRNTATFEPSPFKLAFYLAFFPKVVSGPLERYNSVVSRVSERSVSVELFTSGIRRFIIGLAKKMLIANTVAGVVDQVFSLPANQLPAATAWLGIICFTIQLYFDFSGYTDMAIGLGRMFGFELMENFNYPYISSSIREFWRRWHISMSQWFRDYLYIPLGGNQHGKARTYLNLLIVFLLCGLWHGANWTFVVWGIWYGIFLILERINLFRLTNAAWRPLKHVYALLVIVLGWVFFRSPSLPYAVSFIGAMFGVSTVPTAAYDAAVYVTPAVVLAVLAGIVGSMPFMPAISRYRKRIQTRLTQSANGSLLATSVASVEAVLLIVIFVASIIMVFTESFRPFIYSQF